MTSSLAPDVLGVVRTSVVGVHAGKRTLSDSASGASGLGPALLQVDQRGTLARAESLLPSARVAGAAAPTARCTLDEGNGTAISVGVQAWI